MCHGQIVNEALLHARKAQACLRCEAPIAVGDEYYSGTTRGDDDGLLSRFRLCADCAGLDASAPRDEGMGCVLRDDEDRADPTIRERIAAGLARIRARCSRRMAPFPRAADK